MIAHANERTMESAFAQHHRPSIAIGGHVPPLTNGLSRKIWQKIAMLEEAIRKPD